MSGRFFVRRDEVIIYGPIVNNNILFLDVVRNYRGKYALEKTKVM